MAAMAGLLGCGSVLLLVLALVALISPRLLRMKRRWPAVALLGLAGAMFFAAIVAGVIALPTPTPEERARRVEQEHQRAADRAAHEAATRPREEPEPPAVPRFQIADVLAAYDNNEIAADRQFKGTEIEVVGYVTSIDKGPFGGLYLTMGSTTTGYESPNLRCRLKPSEEDDAAGIQKGARRTVRGRVSGMTLLSVGLDDCEIP